MNTSARKSYATSAIIVGIIEAAWLVAANFTLVRTWITSLQLRGGTPAAIASFVTNPVFHFLVVCAALYLAVRAFKARTDMVPAATSASVLSQANPQTQQVNINFSPLSKDEKPKKPESTRREEPGPNVVFLGAKIATIYFVAGSDLPYFSANGPGEDIAAALVGFRNNTIAGKIVRDAERSGTQVLYYDAQGDEIASILGACWLEEQSDLVDFNVGKTLWLVAALFLNHEKPTVPFYRRTRSGFGDGISIDHHDLNETIETVEVRIIGEWNNELIRVRLHCCVDDKGKPKLIQLEEK